MMTSDTGLANLAIEQVLELSADAHIERRMTAQDSAAFQRLTGAIHAYGKALSLLVALQEREEFFAMIAQLNLPVSVNSRWRSKPPPTLCPAPAENTSGKAKAPAKSTRCMPALGGRAIRSIPAPR